MYMCPKNDQEVSRLWNTL